jgi:hypothetical protein
MIRMLLVGYCYGIRHERRLCQEVGLHLAYRWFCKLDLEDKVPHHSTFSVNRLGRFRESEILRHIFERVVATSMAAGLVKGEGFAVAASVMEANASRYYGKAPDSPAGESDVADGGFGAGGIEKRASDSRWPGVVARKSRLALGRVRVPGYGAIRRLRRTIEFTFHE